MRIRIGHGMAGQGRAGQDRAGQGMVMWVGLGRVG